MPRDTKDTCEHCPAWRKSLDHDGKEMLIERRGNDGQPITKDGAVQYEKGDDGRFLLNGICCLRAPSVFLAGSNFVTVFPTAKSDWFCEDSNRRTMMDRMEK